MDPALIGRLREHAVLGEAPEWELAWLAAHGSLLRLPAGTYAARAGETVQGLYVVLSGCLVIHIERAYGRRKVMEWRGGDVTGVLPYSRMGASPGDSVAQVDTDCLLLPKEHIPKLVHACPEITALLVHVMVDRARRFTTSDQQAKKNLALGKVASGLAHELNNPASALVRGVKGLTDILEQSRQAVRALALLGLTEEEFAVIDRVKSLCATGDAPDWDPLDRADREDALTDWAAPLGVDPDATATLADTPAELEELTSLLETLPAEKRGPAMEWLSCWLSASALSQEMEEGAGRIFDLVSAVKGFTHMDRSMSAAPVDVREGLTAALALVAEKARTAQVTVQDRFDEDLPRVEAVAGELNQVWHNIVDNALDAAAPGGAVEVSATSVNRRVTVEITDNGPGIPDDIRDRIFDPFFTTKEVGHGVGLGLEVVRRVVGQHHGEVEVESAPGRTVFRVSLAAADAPATAAAPASHPQDEEEP